MKSTAQHFAIVVSQFNQVITDKLLQGALRKFESLNIGGENVSVTRVPGAVELPLTAKLLAKTNKYAAIICFGAVIRGETDHYNYVCQQVSAGCMSVMLECEVPVIFGVLTTDNHQQAEDRVGGKTGDMGREAVEAALTMVGVVSDISKDGQLYALSRDHMLAPLS